MKRVFLTVLDGAGVGYLPDAAQYGDVGACTIGHVVEYGNDGTGTHSGDILPRRP